ncbi:EF-hand and coiled-coil domain-containing protein 1, partial [Astyanax mexicanus]
VTGRARSSMETPDACDPYGRPARRTQWIVSTLAYHYGLDRGVENEIIVLATGLDQYLQEIFHHLDCRGEGRVPAEDFRVLCAVLGLGEEAREEEVEESSGILDSLPGEFTFRQFHAKLCGYFSTRAGRGYEDGRLLVGGDSEHIETQIRLRSPLRRRGKLLSPAGSGAKPGCKPGSCTRECYEEIVALEEAEDRMAKLEEENASLRELVEDMRAALQSSDARALALQVRGGGGGWSGVEEVLLLKHQEQKKLEQELRASREAALGLEECNRTLKMEHMEMRKKVEEARQALLVGLGKVKELESKANQIPVLQRHIEQLEMELLYFR